MANPVLDRATRAGSSRRFQSQVAAALAAGRPVTVTIGAGRRPIPGWINTDVVWRRRCYLDATRRWPVPEGSVDFVYADNVIEHFTLPAGRQVLATTYRALAPGGVVRLATPDVEAVARQYLEDGDLARAGMERLTELGGDVRYPVQLVREVYVGAKHYLGFCYDYRALASEMQSVGFDVERVTAGESRHERLRGLENRMHPAEEATQLVVEGRKPS